MLKWAGYKMMLIERVDMPPDEVVVAHEGASDAQITEAQFTPAAVVSADSEVRDESFRNDQIKAQMAPVCADAGEA